MSMSKSNYLTSKRNFLLAIPEWMVYPFDQLEEKLEYRSRTEMIIEVMRKECEKHGIIEERPVWLAAQSNSVQTPKTIEFFASIGKHLLSNGNPTDDTPDVYSLAMAGYESGNIYWINTLAMDLKISNQRLAHILLSMGWERRRIFIEGPSPGPRMLYVPPFIGRGKTPYESVRQ